MKKGTISIIAALLFTCFTSYSQFENNPKRNRYKGMSVEQIADLKTKELTLQLDLNKSQQEKIYELSLVTAQQMKEAKTNLKSKDRSSLSPEERYDLKAKRLDKAIELKSKMKQILTEDQYTKWEKTVKRKMHKRKKQHHRNH